MTEWVQVDGEWHTQQCLDNTEKYEQEKAEYEKRWPGYCRRCNGAGGHWYDYDPSPAGVSLAAGSLTDCDPCPECAEEKGVCPRCGTKMHKDWWQDDEPCPHCGWDWLRGESDALGPPECYCWEHKDYPGWGEVEYLSPIDVYAQTMDLYRD